MTNQEYYNIFDQMIEDLQADNREGLTKVVSSIMKLSMLLEQDKAIQAGHYERNDDRAGHRNGYKSRTIRTRIGEIPIEIPQVRGMEFYPGTIEKGCRTGIRGNLMQLEIAEKKDLDELADKFFQVMETFSAESVVIELNENINRKVNKNTFS